MRISFTPGAVCDFAQAYIGARHPPISASHPNRLSLCKTSTAFRLAATMEHPPTVLSVPRRFIYVGARGKMHNVQLGTHGGPGARIVRKQYLPGGEKG